MQALEIRYKMCVRVRVLWMPRDRQVNGLMDRQAGIDKWVDIYKFRAREIIQLIMVDRNTYELNTRTRSFYFLTLNTQILSSYFGLVSKQIGVNDSRNLGIYNPMITLESWIFHLPFTKDFILKNFVDEIL